MSQPATEAPTGPRPQAGGNILTRKMLGIPGWGWIAIFAVGAGAFIWWRSRKSSSSSSAATAAGATQATCYDANGNTVDCSSPQAVADNSTDYFESLYTQGEGINNQLQTLTPTINTTGTDVAQLLADQSGPPSTGGTGTGGGATKPGPVTDLTVDVISPTLARVSWRPPQFASTAPTSTTYAIQIAPVDKAPHNIGSRTSYNVGGLRAGTHYTATVTPAGGPSSSKAFTTPGKAGTGKIQPGGPIKKAA